MTRSWWFRFFLLMFFIVTAVVHVTPTLGGLDLEKTKFPFKKKVNLGLDLQGGLYMVYSVDFQKVYKEIFERQAGSLREELAKEGLNPVLGKVDVSFAEDPQALLQATRLETVREKIKTSFGLLRVVEEKKDGLVIALSRDYRAEIKDKTLSQSVQVIRNRIDEFGVTEPQISTRGANHVVVELPGVKDVERAKALVGRTARLEFKMVNEDMEPARVAALVAEAERGGITYKDGEKFSDYTAKINAAVKGKIPADSEIAFERGKNEQRVPFLLHSKVELTGNELQDAYVTTDPQTMSPAVSFQLNPRGAVVFGELTEKNVKKFMAIVLDGIVHSAPRINEKIGGGQGQISMGGAGNQEDTFREARDVAIVLRAGALPAQLELMEQRVIGPSLGQDSIKRGVFAGTIGCILVFVFMAIYYRMSGTVAVVSLMLNLLFTLAILIGMDATLTLPGIAGLALTIGMAVDSNVIIFERIRDELLEGRSVAAAVHAGFDKAFSCIFDANITHGIVAIILLNFGSGPIKGFAVTLLVGIITTLFCAVTVCKLFFDWYLQRKGDSLAKISI